MTTSRFPVHPHRRQLFLNAVRLMTHFCVAQERLRAWKAQLEQDDSGSDGGAEAHDPSFRVHSQPPASSSGGGGGFSWDGFKSSAGELQGQNTQLQNQVARAEAEIVRLRGQVENLRSVQEAVSSDSPADAKVIQLAKKIKTLAVAGTSLTRSHTRSLSHTHIHTQTHCI